MIFKYAPAAELSDTDWRRINMRKVVHLIGAEMIHNLYGRYWPQINSIRFSNTKTTYMNGVVESYAPKTEWAYLQKWVSKKFISLDPVIIREINAILRPTYKLTNELCSRIDKTNLQEIDNHQLALLLVDIMDIPLGEIYKLNVVQIEYGLNFAIDLLLQEYEPNSSERNRLLAKLISPQELTVAQEEEVAFGKVVNAVREGKSDSSLNKLLEAHVDAYAGKHCAYGEMPPSLDFYKQKLKTYIDTKQAVVELDKAQKEVSRLYLQSQDLLGILKDERLTTLCNLMSRIGVFRDKNKARLGDTVLRRLAILDEISRRCQVERADIDLYLLTELLELLDNGQILTKEILSERRKGVTFIRSEQLSTTYEAFKSSIKNVVPDKLTGICASPGIVVGSVKIITSQTDISKMNEDDIMVAIGTDFDLIEIMHRAAGIITEEGGLLSHASVVSRELKKPCLIGVPQATKLLKDDLRITLNATEGSITIHE